MRAPLLAAPLALALALLSSATGVAAQAEPSFRGTFVRDAAAGDDMEQVIRNALPKVKSALGRSILGRGTATKRLREVNRPYGWIRFAPEGNTITVETDLWNGPQWKLTTVRNGTLNDWKRRNPEGKVETVRVTTDTQGATMTQRFQAPDGTRSNVYSLSPDGRTLTMNVTVTSDKLTGPITYKLVYRRRD